VLLVVLVAVATLVLVAQVGWSSSRSPGRGHRRRDTPAAWRALAVSLETCARAIEALTDADADAEVIVLDVPGGRTDSDSAFLDALAAAPPVTLSAVRSNSDGAPIVLGGSDALDIEGVRASDGRFDPDDDGVVRRFDHTLDDDDDDDDGGVAATGLVLVPTLPVVVIEQIIGQKLPTDVTGSEGATIDLPGPAGTVTEVSFLSLVSGRIPAEQIAGRVVVVGPTAGELQDTVDTALSETTSRTEVHAAAIDTLLRDVPLRTPPTGVRLLLTLLACLAPLLTVRLNVFRGLVLVFALALGWLVLVQIAFNLGWIPPVVAPIVGLAAAAVATAA
jgi:CHASE2 domain-containing sensor protein